MSDKKSENLYSTNHSDECSCFCGKHYLGWLSVTSNLITDFFEKKYNDKKKGCCCCEFKRQEFNIKYPDKNKRGDLSGMMKLFGDTYVALNINVTKKTNIYFGRSKNYDTYVLETNDKKIWRKFNLHKQYQYGESVAMQVNKIIIDINNTNIDITLFITDTVIGTEVICSLNDLIRMNIESFKNFERTINTIISITYINIPQNKQDKTDDGEIMKYITSIQEYEDDN